MADTESFTVLEGGTATEVDLDSGTSLLDGDTDLDLPNDTLTVNTTPVSGPSFASSFTLNANGTFSYVHDGSENFIDSFTYEVSDALGNTDTATVTITITPVNDNSPVADTESFTVLEGGTATEADLDSGTSLLDGDTDLDLPNDTLTLNSTPVSGPSFASSFILNANGTFSYVHDGSENFIDSFTYEVSDALGNTDTATVTITITPVNDNSPVADTESFTVLEGGTATEADLDSGTSLLDGDTDLDLPNDTLTVNSTPVSGPSFASSFTLNTNGTFSYVHDGSENFIDSFTYEVSDALGNTDTATVTITITPVNDNSPVADTESFTVLEGGTATEADLDSGASLLDGDTDLDLPNDALTVNTTPVSGPSFASSFTLNANGTFSYVHDGSENFIDSFTYEVSDALGNTDTATVTITITPVNDNSPVADTESFTVLEGGTATEADLDSGTSLLDGDTDLDLPNDTLTVNSTPVSGPSFASSFTLNANGTFSYVHDGSENFIDSFTYEVSDALGNTDTATVTITITPVNDAPTVSLSSVVTNLNEDSDTSSAIVVATITITDDALGTETLTLSGADATLFEIVGSDLRLIAGAALDFETNPVLDVTVNVDDAAIPGAPDDFATYFVMINNVNEAPTAIGGTSFNTFEDAADLVFDMSTWFVDQDFNDPTLSPSVVSVSTPSWLNASVDATANQLTVSTISNAYGTSQLTVRAIDSSGLSVDKIVDINVAPVNDTITIVDQTYIANTSVIHGDVLTQTTDVDGESLSVILVTGPSNGIFLLQHDGEFTFTPDLGFNGADSFVFFVDDGVSPSSQTTVLINVVAAIAPQPTTTPTNLTSEDEEPQSETADPVELDLESPVADSPTDDLIKRLRPGGANSLANPEDLSETIVELPLQLDELVTGQGIFTRILTGSPNFKASTVFDASLNSDLSTTSSALSLLGQPGLIWNALDEFKNGAESDFGVNQLAIGTIGTVSSSLVVGYVVWAIRSGLMLSSLVATMPAWNLLDPLAIIPVADAENETDSESLEDIVNSQKEKLEPNQNNDV